MPTPTILSTRNGSGSVSGYRDDLVAGDLVGLSLSNYTGITSVLWELIGRPEGSAAGGAGPEPIFLATANSTAFNVDSDSGDFRLDGTYTVQATLNPGSPGQVRITTVLCRLSGLTIPGPGASVRVLRKLGGFEALEDTSVPTVLQGWATELNRWLELLRETVTGGAGGFTTLAGAYSHGADSSDQTMVLHDALGGGIIIDATQGNFTGASALRINTAAGSPVVVDRATGRVGVGIAAPLQAVHAKGSAPALRLDRTGGAALDVMNVGDDMQFLNGATVLGIFKSTGGLQADLGVGIGTPPATFPALAFGAGSATPISAAGTARFRYNEGTGHAEFSENAGPYLPFASPFSAYQTIDANGTPLTQRTILNFSADLAAVDNAGATRTDVSLANAGAGAGTYGGTGLASITLDAKGRVTAAVGATYVIVTTHPATSVLGNPTGSSGSIVDIAATVDGQFLGRAGGVLVWSGVPYSSLTGAPTIYYQTIDLAGTPLIQRPSLNFSAEFGVVDNGGATRTDVSISAIAGSKITGTANTIPFFNGAGALAEAANAIGYDPTNVRVGSRVSSGLPLYQLHLVDEAGASDRGATVATYQTGTLGPLLTLQAAQGTYASPTAVDNTKYGGRLAWQFHDGTSFVETAKIFAHVTPGSTVSTGVVRTDLALQAATGGAALSDAYSGSGTLLALLARNGTNAYQANPLSTLPPFSHVFVGTALFGFGALSTAAYSTATFGAGGVQFNNPTQVLVKTNSNTDSSSIRILRHARSRGTDASPLAVAGADTLGSQAFYGYDGSGYTVGNVTRGFVDFDGTVSAGAMPADWGIFSGDGTGLPSLFTSYRFDVVAGDWSQMATNSVSGFFRLASVPGVPTGVPYTIRISAAGGATTTATALAADTTHARLYGYFGHWAPIAQDTTALSSGFLKNTTSTGIWTVDTTTYLSQAYVTVEAAGSVLPQRSILNFDATLTASDSASPARTNVGLPSVGPGAGTIGGSGIASVTLDAQGRVTAAATATYLTSAFYQTIKNSVGTAEIQRANLKFLADFAVADSTPDTTVALVSQGGFTAGAFTNTNITVNQAGVITAISNGSAGSAFYQTVDAAGTPLTQRPTLNFSADLPAVDNGGATRTDVSLANAGAGAGTYGGAGLKSLTLDAKGRVTAVTTATYLIGTGASPGTFNNVTITGDGLVTGGSNVAYLTSAFYQTVAEAGSALTQRGTLNFDGTVVAADDVAHTRTNVGLPNVGPGAGLQGGSGISGIVLDAQGRVTTVNATSYYSTIQAFGGGLTQRPTLNFDHGVVSYDDGANSRTDVRLGSVSAPSAPTIAEFGGVAPSAVAAANLQAVYQWDAINITLTGVTHVTGNGLGLVNLQAPTITDASAVTVDAAATFAISGAPTAGGSVTLTHPISLWVQSGATQLDGWAAINTPPGGVPTNTSLIVTADNNNDRDRVQFFLGGGTLGPTGTGDSTFFDILPSNTSVNSKSPSSPAIYSTVRVRSLNYSGGSALDSAAAIASLYIDAAPTTSFMTGPTFALYVGSGDVHLGSTLEVVSTASAARLIATGASAAFDADGSGGTAAISFFGAAGAPQQTGGAASAGALYTSTEQGMINRMYSALRTYGLLT